MIYCKALSAKAFFLKLILHFVFSFSQHCTAGITVYRQKTGSSCRHTYETKRPLLNENQKLLLLFDLKIIELVNQLHRVPFKFVITINVTIILLTILKVIEGHKIILCNVNFALTAYGLLLHILFYKHKISE